jgi:hypothetical protein
MSSPIVIAYYGQVKTFSYTELQDGTFDNWINSVYLKYQSTSPCQGVGVTTTTTTTTNTTLNIVSNVMNLGAISNVGSVNVDVGSSTSSGTNIGTTKTNNSNDNRTSSRNRTSSSTSGSNSSGNSSGENGKSNDGGNSSENQSGNSPDNSSDNPSNPGSGEGNGGSSGSSSSGSGSSSGSSQGGGGSGGKTEEKTEVQTEKPTEQKVEETKTEQQKTQSSSTAKAAGKAKAEVAKPAILVTGDLVGIQTKSDGAQDARGTASFTRVKGDGTSSLGVSADYMVNAKIGNLSCVRSWIGTNKKGNKHISVVSDGLSLMPRSMSNTLLFVRVNSVKNFKVIDVNIIIDTCYNNIRNNIISNYSLIHGDCQFSNILFDEMNDNIYFIDPRGYFGKSKLFGPKEYDYAKIIYALTGYDDFNNNNAFYIDICNNNLSYNFKSYNLLLSNLNEITNKNIINKITLSYLIIIWLGLAQYNENNPLKCITSYYHSIYLFNYFYDKLIA